MGITREDFSILVKGLKAVYTDPKFIPDKFAFDVWYELLKDIPYQELNKAIQRFMSTSTKIPTPADLRNMIVTASESGMSEQSAFALLRKAVRNSTYHSEEEFSKLPEVIQIAVGNPSNLREWASMDTEDFETVQQSQFLRAYRNALERRRTNETLPNDLRIAETILAPRIATQSVKQIGEVEGVPMPDRIKEKLRSMNI